MTAPCASQMESFIGQPGLYLPADWACGMRLHTPAAGLRLTCIDAHAARRGKAKWKGRPRPVCACCSMAAWTPPCAALGRCASAAACAPSCKAASAARASTTCTRGGAFGWWASTSRPKWRRRCPPICAAPGSRRWQRRMPRRRCCAPRATSSPAPCPLPEGPARRLWLHAKALEALALFAHQSARQSSQLRPANARASSPHAADLPRLRRVHALLQQHCEQPWTAAELARLTGLNEKRLQAGFQHLYGLRTCSRSRHGRAGRGFGRSAALRSLPMARAIGGAARLATHPKSHPIRLAPKS